MTLIDYLEESATLIKKTATDSMSRKINSAAEHIVSALLKAKPFLVCGNGGSAADALHIAGELAGRYLKERKALNCIALSGNAALLTAWGNDYSYDTIFSRQVEAYGQPGGVLMCISTSGNSVNVLQAAKTAHEKDMTVIGLTGESGGKLAQVCDVVLNAPSANTPMVQQIHICLYHYLCEIIEIRMAAADKASAELCK